MTPHNPPAAPSALPALRSALAVGLGLGAVKLILHLWMIERYGFHRDELYFIECGKRIAFGYVDHAPFVPWVAAAAGWFDHHLIALRLPSVLAGAVSILLTVLLARAWGGGVLAQLISGLSVLSAPAFLVRLMPSFCATSSRVIPEASIQRDSLVSRLRGLPRERFPAAAIASQVFDQAAAPRSVRASRVERSREHSNRCTTARRALAWRCS